MEQLEDQKTISHLRELVHVLNKRLATRNEILAQVIPHITSWGNNMDTENVSSVCFEISERFESQIKELSEDINRYSEIRL